MLGSWAGAMGQTQFMPSSFMKFAVDGNRDGRRDIWTSVPDALASTANYLRQQGWQPGLPWGFEVELPQGFDFRNLRQGFASWHGLGLRRVDGKPMPRSGEATLSYPAARAARPSWSPTITPSSRPTIPPTPTRMGVAHLGDRLLGGRRISGEWPKDEPQLDRDQRQEVQQPPRWARASTRAIPTASSAPRPARRCGTSSSGAASSPTATPTSPLLRELRAAR